MEPETAVVAGHPEASFMHGPMMAAAQQDEIR
jgi:hypothetical protein